VDKVKFLGKMKRLFDKKSKKEPEPEIGTNTIDRIVKDKEGVKKRLEEEEKEFLQKKRDYERKMIEFEKQEVTRRQQEVEEKKEALSEHQRKNLMIQDKVQEQIKVLNMKLEEYRINHRASEAELETEISQLNDTIAEVQNSLSERIEAYGEDVLSPSAPRMSQDSFDTASLRGAHMSPRTLSPRVSRGDLDCPDGEESDSLYPTLPSSSMPRSISLGTVHHEVRSTKHALDSKMGGSLGSSPQISNGSGTSSRSLTPKIDSDTSI